MLMISRIKNFLLNNRPKLSTEVDLHSHFIPEIDDGCRSVEESIHLILQMKKLGYKKLVTTPHIMSHRYPNTIDIIKKSLFEIRSILKVKNIDIEINASAEYYFDEHFIKLIKEEKLFPFGQNYILFELPYTTRPNDLESGIRNLLEKCYKPVLAHPERYRFLNKVSEYRTLKKLGVYFQVNINSLTGYYGKEVQKKALMLSQKSMIDFVGSDIHHQKHMDHFIDSVFSNHVETLFSNNKILNDTI